MRILQIVPSVALVYGGPSQMVLGLSAALAKAGAEVTILTTDANGDVGQPPLAVPLGEPIEQDGYTVRYFRCAPFRRYKFSLGLLRWLSEHASDYDIAHIHALFSPISSASAWVARSHRLPYILRPLGTLDPADLCKKWRLKQLYAALIERKNLAHAAALHFTTPREAEISHTFGTKPRSIVIPPGITIPPLDGAPSPADEWKLPRDRPILLFLSRIDPKKGLDLLLPALERLIQQQIPFHFVLAGSNPQDPTYERWIYAGIRASSLASHTTITGFVEGSRKQALLRQADVFVLPSYYENFGIAVAEAMASGLPVVISEQVYIADRVRAANAGWVVPCDVKALTIALREALQAAQVRSLRGAMARRCAESHYSWQAIAQQTLTAYTEILER